MRRIGVGWWGLLCVVLTEGALFGYLLFSYLYYAVQLDPGMSQSLLKRATGRCWFARLSGKDIGFKHRLICMLNVVGIEGGA